MTNEFNKDDLTDLARTHDGKECAGLPMCVSCRVSVLIECGSDIDKAEEKMATYKCGEKVSLKKEGGNRGSIS